MTKEEIIEKVKENMQSIGFKYDKSMGINCYDKKVREIMDESLREVYGVSFKIPDDIKRNSQGEIISLREGSYCVGYVDAATYEILCYSVKFGFVLPDGTSV
jgi:hypothetical protein